MKQFANYNLFLDDIRNPWQVNWIKLPLVPYKVIRNYEAFVAIINRLGIPKIITFDHDLADIHYKNLINGINNENCIEKTGYDCCKFLIDRLIEENYCHFPEWYVHSLNPIGAENIKKYIKSFIKSKCSN